MDLYEADTDGSSGIRALFDAASLILGKDVRELLQADAEVLKRTDMSQVAITVASLAAVKALAKRGIRPSACAGFSLGEYPALATAGVVSEKDVLKLVFERGRIMQSVADEIAASAGPADGSSADGSSAAGSSVAGPGMAAVLGLSPDAVDAVIESMVKDGKIDGKSLFGANYNSPLQTVISGTAAALTAAEEAFKAAGARRVLRLKVAGPFHSPLMAKAGTAFSSVLETVSFADPKLPLFSNVTGARVTSGSEAKACAVAHISNPVRWTMEEAAIAALLSSGAAEGSSELVEVGPGKVLSGLWADSKHAGVCKPYTEILGA
jgi:[acyl-carrier-protein] S-malonyltransferase